MSQGVVLCPRTRENIDKSRTTGFTAEVFDLSEISALPDFSRKISEELSGVDCVILNAGVSGVPMDTETPQEKSGRETHTHAVNYEAPVVITESLADELRKNKGVVVYLTSRFAKVQNPPESARPYADSKRQLEQYFTEFAADPANKDILVIGIDPGPVDTKLRQSIIESKAAPELSALATKEKEHAIDPELLGKVIFRIITSKSNLNDTADQYDKNLESGSIVNITDEHINYERQQLEV